MRSRTLSLWLPNLATDRLLRRARREGNGLAPPLVTFESSQGALRVAAPDPLAVRAGLHPGMMLADARARVPGLQTHPAEPERDLALLEDLVCWCERYTPYVALDRSFAHAQGGALWLDISGCAHLCGGEAALRADLLARLARQGFSAAAAIADHPGTAWAVARYGSPAGAIVPPGGAGEAIAPLPVAALRIAPEQTRMLERLGLARIASLYPLPRQALAARFGAGLLTRLDQALGRTGEPISPVRPRRAHRAGLVLAEPIVHVAGVQALTRHLLDRLCCGLELASAGARRLRLTLFRVDHTLVAVAIGTSRPCRDAGQLMRLFGEKLERVDPGFGIERALLAAGMVEPLLPETVPWRGMGAGDPDQVHDLAPLVDRLCNRLGRHAVLQLAPQARHVPECAQRRVPALSPLPPVRLPALLACSGAPARPLRLLARPEPIVVVAALPDEAPRLFRWRHVVHRVARARGPERIAPEWWRCAHADADALTRDYFAVEDESGTRFWLFREGLWRADAASLPRWYLHGLFA